MRYLIKLAPFEFTNSIVCKQYKSIRLFNGGTATYITLQTVP
jgi:polyhydroxyalkanoate synthesis regulator protein